LTRINTGETLRQDDLGVMFESPLEWCRTCRDWVALDQSWEEHVRECGCRCVREACPLAALFRPSGTRNDALTPMRK
jgi:hypothetical protein